ncbi:MAG: GatB/YqeY domain-containing protein [candidate division NC10 bacterium]|nr:GatB/YqeY domain-containing protein [candidate division NC10 bacterium]
MGLKARLQQDLKDAMRAKDELRVSVIRLLNALIKNREVDKRRELTETELLEAVAFSSKLRREAIEEYRRAGREDLAGKEEAELRILELYLPPPLSKEELLRKVEEVIADVGASSLKDMGKVMARLMPEILGRVDGRLASEMVKEVLSRAS